MTLVHRNSEPQGYEGTGIILFQDVTLSVVASLLSLLLVRWLAEPIPDFTRHMLLWLGCSLVASLAGELIAGSHKVVRRWATVRSSARLLESIVIKEVLLTVVLAVGWVRLPSAAFCVLCLLTDTMLTALMLFYIRFAARVFSKSEVNRIKKEAARLNALVAGTTAESVAFAAGLKAQGEYNVVGFISEDKNMAGRVISDIVVFYCRSSEDIEHLEWRLGGVDCVFFPREVNTRSPDTSGHSAPSGHSARSEESPVLPSDLSRMSLVSNGVKRAFDMGLSAVLLLVFSPLALLCALAVKLEDGGPVLYKQERMGRGGIPFHILKFRSMRTDAEAGGAQLYSGDGDPRLTRVGGFLRRHHLDELPQLWNVFRGDMSFIGYRPERQYYISQIMQHNPRYRYLYQIRPGVTSYATLYNGYTDTLDKMLTRLDLDLYYLRNQSILFDIKVLGLTFLSIVSGKEF